MAGGLGTRLYRGETEFPVVRKRKVFYVIATVLVLISIFSMLFRGFNLGVEFKGGAIFQWPAQGASVEDARDLFEEMGYDPIVQTVGRGDSTDLRVQTGPLTTAQVDEVIASVDERFPVAADDISPSVVGPSWGDQVTNKALQGLVAFLIAVVIYISLRFEPKIALASIVGLLHDLALAAGIYSITQFVVTPSTIIALLTVLGFSLYDSVVVFDKLEENTKGLLAGSRQTYSEAAELAVNQTFMRSLNTTLIAILPVSGLLFVGAFLLGAGTLKDLSLALFIGLSAGAYSSLCVCTPLVVDLKEREPQYKALTARVLARRSGQVAKAGSSRFAQRAAARAAGETVAGPDEGTAAVETGAVVVSPTAAPPRAATPGAPAKRPQPSKKKKGGRPGRPSGKRRR